MSEILDFFKITIGSSKFMQIATLQIYLCYSSDWSTDSILLKINMHVRYAIMHVWNNLFF